MVEACLLQARADQVRAAQERFIAVSESV
jgi:hypothetical protein